MKIDRFWRIGGLAFGSFFLFLVCKPGEPLRSNRIKEDKLYFSPQELGAMLGIQVSGNGLYYGYRHILWKDEKEMKDGVFEFYLEQRKMKKTEITGEHYRYAGTFRYDRLQGDLLIEFFRNIELQDFENYSIRLHYRNGACVGAGFAGRIGKKMTSDYKLETDDTGLCNPKRLAEYAYRKWDRERVGREP